MFPDFARSIGAANALHQADQQNAIQLDRMRRADAAEAREAADAPHVAALLKGDRTAFDRVSPQTAIKLAPYLDRMDTNQRARLKEQFEVTGRTAAGILSLPEDQQPAAYEAAYQNLSQQGYKINLPPRWSPGLKGQLQSYAIQVPEYLKQLGDQPQAMPLPGGGPAAPGGTGNAANAIAGIESGGRYDAVGPVANSKGQRAYGKYQIMDFNVGPWTQEVLGQAMTPEQFLANPQAQDQVFNTKFGQYVAKHGSPEAASRAWFAGEGGMNNPNATDVLGTTVQGYGQRFAQAYGQGATGPGPQIAQGSGGDGSGNPVQPVSGDGDDPVTLRQYVHSKVPGARVLGVRGEPVYDKQGRLRIMLPNGQTDSIDVPKAKAKEPGTGPFAGTSVDAQALNMLIANGTLSPQQAAELAAGKTITNPADGSVMFMTPSGLFKQAPGGQPMPAAPGAAVAPAAPGQQPASGIQVTPGKTPESFKKLATEVESVNRAIDNFNAVLKEAGGVSFKAFLNDPRSPEAQKINGAFNSLKTALRSEAFVNTGVLQPAEMTMLDNMLLAPTTVRGLMATPEAYGALLGEIKQFVSGKMEAARAAYGQPGAAPPTTPTESPQQQSGSQAGEKRLTPEEAQKLAPGTTFIGQDGVRRVRQ